MSTFIKYLRDTGYLHILYALLIEAIPLILISFMGLFTLETILPGLISTRFAIGKIIIVVTFLFFFVAWLGKVLDLSFPIDSSRTFKVIITLTCLWTLGILTVSLLAFPLMSIPLSILAFAAIGYYFWKEIGK